ncbi:MAG: 30S ribosomal protein S1, partial [Bacteroidia bacterium]
EVIDFKVLEFNKESKKIIVSHRNTVEGLAIEEKEARPARGGKKAAEANSGAGDETKKAVKKVKDNLEKTTLGDVSALANLKTELEKNEKSK